MKKWNEEAVPNNNMTSADIEYTIRKNKENQEFSEELADGGERNERYEKQKNKES
ncbi:hypothetical protein [Siminovitchia terrae]|uniref:hypothetical protein n=1 Tax=Siminovitchia terrae TaxID=1914933 RepID=UPI00163D3A74|nr:hypothetical protein [Siminovitchia terrae]